MKANYRAAKVAAGMCPSCTARPPIPGGKSCQICLDRARRNAKIYRRKNGAKAKAAVKKWRTNNTAANRAIFKRHTSKLKLLVFQHYGMTCKCCNESFEFLTLDHINGGGGQHRRELGRPRCGGDAFYRWVIKNNFPDYLQPLCFNCNWAKYVYGMCPHESRRKADRERIVNDGYNSCNTSSEGIINV